MDGEVVCFLEATPDNRLVDLQARLLRQVSSRFRRVAVTLPSGDLLANVLSEQPFACLAGYARFWPGRAAWLIRPMV